MSLPSQNIRFHLWITKVPRHRWTEQLATWLQCSEMYASSILADHPLSPQELKDLSGFMGVTDSELAHADLLGESQLDIWQENVSYLLAALEHGENSKLANEIGVSQGTISKWKKRSQRPEHKYQAALKKYFGLNLSENLWEIPLFLSPIPVGAEAKRRWLHQQIERMSHHSLETLFPALERLFREY